ncbi:MAG: ABC transporter substrate-binding protein [Eubacteriales bacterium]|nr:ABC transporter substrate-binding protein [Eubacteriales bacterium]
MMKRKMTALMMAVVMAASLAGCGANANANNPNTATTAAAGSETSSESGTAENTQAAGGNTLTVAFAEGGKTLNPSQATDSTSAVFINAAYDQLVTYGETTDANGYKIADTGNIQPSLAKSWETSEDGLSYVIHLDENAKFANGDPVTADAVIFSFDHIKNSNYTGFLYTLANIETMEKNDDYTITFQLSKPCTIFFNLLQMHIFSIVNPAELEGMSTEEIDTYLTTNTAGSGAFEIEKWEATTEAVLNARTDYWKGKVALDKVLVKIVPEASNRVLLADKGDVDVSLVIPPKDLATLEGNENLDIRSYESVSITYLSMNTQNEALSDVRVRQAINYAMPYDSIVTDVLSGQAKKLDHVIPSAMPGYIDTDEGVYTQDFDKAKELLAEAGYSDGLELDMILSNGNQDNADSAILIQDALSKVGVTVNIEKMERPQYLEATSGHNFDLAIAGYSAFVNDPGYFFGNCLYSKGEYNYGSYKSDRVDAIWEEAESINDIQKRYELYGEAQLIVAEDAPWAPLYEKSTIVVTNKSVTDYKYYPDGSMRFAEIAK